MGVLVKWVAASVAAAVVTAFAAAAGAQGVDRFEFSQMQKQVRKMSEDVERMRNALSGGNIQQRFNALEDEISRLTGQIERLEFAVRNLENEQKRRLDDLEYRIIELEGGDPSILFQNDGGSDQGAVAPSIAAPPQPSGGGSLGTITTTAAVGGGERAAFDAGKSAVASGRTVEGRSALQRFLSDHPSSALAGDANYWLGESYFLDGEYQAAANRYLDGATLYPGAKTAPDSLLKLGVTLSLLGQIEVACSTLKEVRQRYPNAAAVVEKAEAELRRTGCG